MSDPILSAKEVATLIDTVATSGLGDEGNARRASA